MNDLLIQLQQFSTTELILGGSLGLLVLLVLVLFWRIKSLSYNFYSKSMTSLVENQATRILQLEKRVELQKREDTGIILNWGATRNDRSAYLLNIFNDSPEKIFNIRCKVDTKYAKFCRFHHKDDKLDSEKTLNVFFIPGGWNDTVEGPARNRLGFADTWLKNKLKAIPVRVEYTTTPASKGKIEHIDILFTKDQLSHHLREAIRKAKVKPNLTSLPTQK